MKKILFLIFALVNLFNFGISAGAFFISPNYSCPWARGDGRCNSDTECCVGMRCSSFGRCELNT